MNEVNIKTALLAAGLMTELERRKVNACNLSQEEIEERDKPKSRQVRRQEDRAKKKKRNHTLKL